MSEILYNSKYYVCTRCNCMHHILRDRQLIRPAAGKVCTKGELFELIFMGVCAQPDIRLDLDAQAGPARIWVQQEAIQREIAYIFRKFLRDFADETTGELLYKQRMRDMCTSMHPTHPSSHCSHNKTFDPRLCHLT